MGTSREQNGTHSFCWFSTSIRKLCLWFCAAPCEKPKNTAEGTQPQQRGTCRDAATMLLQEPKKELHCEQRVWPAGRVLWTSDFSPLRCTTGFVCPSRIGEKCYLTWCKAEIWARPNRKQEARLQVSHSPCCWGAHCCSRQEMHMCARTYTCGSVGV